MERISSAPSGAGVGGGAGGGMGGSSLDIPIHDDNDRYELIGELGTGNFSVARLMRDKITKEPVAIKYIQRGEKIDENVKREIVNHRSLRHPNIVRFKEVFLTPSHLAIVMEYAAGGELFDRICNAGKFSEDEARFFFQQLISGVSYCHTMQICHRDLKLENTLLDGSQAPRLKICDFGYSKIADVWSCGVTLYVMLMGSYPFEDPEDPRNFRKTIRRILNVQYTIPDHMPLSPECRELLSRIFVGDPSQRISMAEIKAHEWFLKNLPADLAEGAELGAEYQVEVSQSVEEIDRIITEARSVIPGYGIESYLSDVEFDDMDFDNDDLDDLDDLGSEVSEEFD